MKMASGAENRPNRRVARKKQDPVRQPPLTSCRAPLLIRPGAALLPYHILFRLRLHSQHGDRLLPQCLHLPDAEKPLGEPSTPVFLPELAIIRSHGGTISRSFPGWHCGKCANCGEPIAFRYLGVELLTGLLFLAVWLKTWPELWLLAFPYWILVSLLVVATFIDFEHFIIPDEITWGGALAGVLLSSAIPQLHGLESPLASGLWSLIGAASGYALLWLVVEMGKIAFGKKAYAIAKPMPFTWLRRPVQTPKGKRATRT